MSKIKTLEDFVKAYVNNKAISDTKESFGSWVASQNPSTKMLYSNKISSINTDYMKSKPTYGSTAENLYSNGLAAGGYSDYISSRINAKRQANIDAATTKYAASESKDISEYNKYITAKREEETASEKNSHIASFESIVNKLEESGVIDFDSAYTYAIGAGLSEKQATMAAESAGYIVKRRLRDKVVERAVSMNMSKEQSYKYAIALGLDETEATEISTYIQGINELVKIYKNGSYSDYPTNKTDK